MNGAHDGIPTEGNDGTSTECDDCIVVACGAGIP